MSDPTVAPRRATILLYQGDDRERLEQLLADIEGKSATAAAAPARMADTDTDVAEAVEAYNAFLPEAEARATKVVVQAIGNRKWRRLRNEHTKPGEDGGDGEVDMEAFSDALLTFADDANPEMRTIAEPRFDHPGKLDAFLDSLSEADYNRLFTAAYAVNYTAGVSDPKALDVSVLTLPNDAT